MVAPAGPRLIPVAPVAQKDGHDCGAAAARAVLALFGRPARGVGKALRPCPKDGTPPDRLAWLFVASGLGVGMRGRMTLNSLAGTTAGGHPVLCPVQFGGGGHWVVVRGVRRGVHLMCPARGLVAVPESEFLESWRDEAGGVPLDRFGLCVFPLG